jgi:hypothetical protein
MRENDLVVAKLNNSISPTYVTRSRDVDPVIFINIVFNHVIPE